MRSVSTLNSKLITLSKWHDNDNLDTVNLEENNKIQIHSEMWPISGFDENSVMTI